jgi:hypothetical protein
MTLLYLHGALTLGCLLIGVKFLKFWRLSRDRFFVFFTGAFWVFAIGWALRAFVATPSEHGHLIYIPRLVGFVMILVGIFDKNRRSREDTG